MGSSTESLVLLVRARNQASGALTSVSRDLDKIDRKQKGGTATALKYGKFGAKALLGVGTAAAALAVTSVKAFGDFEAALNKSLSIMGDVAPALRDEMSETAREVAKNTTFSAEQAAEAYFFLASAGLDAQQSIAAMSQVAKFAQAGMFDMSRATDLATDAQSALGLTSKDSETNLANLTRTTDVLVKANTLANASVEQFSESLTNKAGAAIKVVGKDIEEGVAVLAAFADQGVKGAEAGTALNIVMRDLQTSTLKNKGAWDELGISVFDGQGEMRNMADIIGDLEGLLEGASDKQKKMTLAQLGFNDKSVSFIQTLLGSSDAIREYEKQLRNAGGTTEDVADKQLETINAQFSLLKSHAEDALITLGEELAPTVRDELLPALKMMIDSTSDFLEVIGPGLVKALVLATDAISGMQYMILSTIGVWDDEARRKSEQIVLNRELAKGLGENMSATDRLATSMVVLAQKDAWTVDGLKGLITTTGASAAETAAATKKVLAHAEAAGYDQKWIDMLTEATADATAEIKYFSPEKARAEEITRKHSDAMEDDTGALEDNEDALDDVSDATEEALSWQEKYTNAVKAASDPVFAAISSLESMQGAVEKVTELEKDGKKGTEEWQRAQLDLASATIDAQDSLDDMNADQLKLAMEAISQATGLTIDEVGKLLEDIGLLDGANPVITLGVNVPQIKFTQSGNTMVATNSGMRRLATGGSFYRGERIMVGEDGIEMMTAATGGHVRSNPGTVGGNNEGGNFGGDNRPTYGQVNFYGTPERMLADLSKRTAIDSRFAAP